MDSTEVSGGTDGESAPITHAAKAPPIEQLIGAFVLIALGAFAVHQYQRLPRPMSGVVYAHRPANLPSSDFAVILHSSADLAEVDNACAEAAKRDLRWLVTLVEKERVTLVPDGSPVAIVESPSTLDLLNGFSLYKVRVIDGDAAGQVGYIPHASLVHERSERGKVGSGTVVPNPSGQADAHSTPMERSGIPR